MMALLSLAAFVFLLVAGVPHAAAVLKEKEERIRNRYHGRMKLSETLEAAGKDLRAAYLHLIQLS